MVDLLVDLILACTVSACEAHGLAVVGRDVVGLAVVGLAVVGRDVVGLAVVGRDVVGLAVVGLAVVGAGFEVGGFDEVGFEVVAEVAGLEVAGFEVAGFEVAGFAVVVALDGVGSVTDGDVEADGSTTEVSVLGPVGGNTVGRVGTETEVSMDVALTDGAGVGGAVVAAVVGLRVAVGAAGAARRRVTGETVVCSTGPKSTNVRWARVVVVSSIRSASETTPVSTLTRLVSRDDQT